MAVGVGVAVGVIVTVGVIVGVGVTVGTGVLVDAGVGVGLMVGVGVTVGVCTSWVMVPSSASALTGLLSTSKRVLIVRSNVVIPSPVQSNSRSHILKLPVGPVRLP